MDVRADRASATAETAVALPALVVVLGVCLWVLAVAATTLRCAEAARAAARAAARGEPAAEILATARRTAGHPVAVTTTRAGDLVTITVAWRVTPPVPFLARLLPAITLDEAATAEVEPRAGSP